jgi:NAD dependent epimerase/dehydratase
MNWQGKKVLVTGAGGFIASHLVERLVELGAHVRAFTRYNSRHDIGLLKLLPPEKLATVEVIAGDLRDAEAVAQGAHNVEVIFHLGALIAIPYSYLHPREVVETNIMGTYNVLTAARQHQVAKVVHTSTSEVYGTAQYVPIDEHHPLQGQSPYSASKIGADKIAESFQRSFNVPVATIRPFNTYGPRQSARAVIPTVISQILTGNEVRLGSLHPTRDFTFVKDTAAGFILVAESPRTIGEEINVGSDAEISIGDLVQKIATLTGREVNIVSEAQRLRPQQSEVERLWADNRKAKELIGWQPQTTLDDGLRQTIDWIAQNLGRYRPDVYEV